MSIGLKAGISAINTLRQENTRLYLRESKAANSKCSKCNVLILNLMPTKERTEAQLSRLLANTSLLVDVTFMRTSTYKSKNVDENYMLENYVTFDEIKDQHFDGFIVTGAPVEHLKFEEVDYYNELKEIFDWSLSNVKSTLYICYGAQAGLYHHYFIDKLALDKKQFGIFSHYKTCDSMLFNGFEDEFYVPHSRHTFVSEDDILSKKDLKILAKSNEAGVYAVENLAKNQIFLFGHIEYDKDTLKDEYTRDKNANLDIDLPKNYFAGDDHTKDVIFSWKTGAELLFRNWIEYYISR